MGAQHDRPATVCPMCGLPVEQQKWGRPRVYCGDDCKQAAYRRRTGQVVYAQGRQGYRLTAAPFKRFDRPRTLAYGTWRREW